MNTPLQRQARILSAVQSELDLASRADELGDATGPFSHIERAHELGQEKQLDAACCSGDAACCGGVDPAMTSARDAGPMPGQARHDSFGVVSLFLLPLWGFAMNRLLAFSFSFMSALTLGG